MLDENEKSPLSTRLPISAFDVNKEDRELAVEAAKAKERRLARDAEERIAQLQRSTCYLRERFLDPLIVRPRSIYSFFDRSKVTNYPLMQLTPREAEFPSPFRFSTDIRELVSRYLKIYILIIKRIIEIFYFCLFLILDYCFSLHLLVLRKFRKEIKKRICIIG